MKVYYTIFSYIINQQAVHQLSNWIAVAGTLSLLKDEDEVNQEHIYLLTDDPIGYIGVGGNLPTLFYVLWSDTEEGLYVYILTTSGLRFIMERIGSGGVQQ
jgi:hypothetical protein